MSLHSLYHPEIFQGNLLRTRYFEGWYFKQVTADCTGVLSVIPGVSLAATPHAFIQVIDGISGTTHYIEYPITEFHADKTELLLSIGASRFSRDGMKLDIDEQGLRLVGELAFTNLITWPSKLWAPGIMGWYSFVPRMECYHAVVSLDHTLAGHLEYQGKTIDFDMGRGYIEKDWGTSMPESWIWLHANTFQIAGTSVMLSVAKIPWGRSFFTGFIAFVLHDGEIYRFATYNGSRIAACQLLNQDLSIKLSNNRFTLEIKAHQRVAGKLKAPVRGLMERYIKESIDSDLHIRLTRKDGSQIFEGAARRTGLELVGEPDKLVERKGY
jgi:hypothetical protein